MARPPAETAGLMDAVLPALGLDAGSDRWPAGNLHQSFSSGDPADREPALRRVLEQVHAPAFDLLFNRVSLGDRWLLRAQGVPPGFAGLLAEVRAAMEAEGVGDDSGHTPHVTLCYFPPYVQEGTRWLLSPIRWRVDAIELVAVAHHPYRYRTLARQPLPSPPQGELFDAPLPHHHAFPQRTAAQDTPWD
ncbi:2'-5' RNA ligase family protein [Luteimonas sp. A611]